MSKSIHYSHVVDLSHVITPEIPLWPGDPPVEFETVARLERDGYTLRRFAMGEHSATHMNAPLGFDTAGAGIDRYWPEALIVPAVVIDVCRQAAADADFSLLVDEIARWEAVHGRIPAGSLVVLYTGWQERWHDPAAFLDRDRQGGLHFPGFAELTIRFLLERRGIAGVGSDAHGIDPGQSTDFASNRLVLARQGIVLENLTNLDQLPPTGTTLVIGILRLQGGSGSPASVLALVP